MSKTKDQAKLDQLRDKEDNDERLTAKEAAEFRAILKRNPYLNRKARALELNLSRD